MAALAAMPSDTDVLTASLEQLEQLKRQMRPADSQDVRGLLLTTVRGAVGDLIRMVGQQLRDGDRKYASTIQRMCGGLRHSVQALRKI